MTHYIILYYSITQYELLCYSITTVIITRRAPPAGLLRRLTAPKGKSLFNPLQRDILPQEKRIPYTCKESPYKGIPLYKESPYKGIPLISYTRNPLMKEERLPTAGRRGLGRCGGRGRRAELLPFCCICFVFVCWLYLL